MDKFNHIYLENLSKGAVPHLNLKISWKCYINLIDLHYILLDHIISLSKFDDSYIDFHLFR